MAISVKRYPGEVALSRNPIGFFINADTAWESNDDYFVRITVETEDSYRSGSYSELMQVDATPTQEDSIEIDLQRALEGLVSSDTPRIQPGKTRICQAVAWRYNVQIQEYIDGIAGQTVHYEDLVLLKGGRGSGSGQDVFSWINDFKFLTQMPRAGKRSEKQLPEYLFYMIPRSLGSVTLKLMVEITYENGLTASYDPGISQAADFYEVIEWRVGFLDLALEKQGLVAAWKIWLEVDGGPLDGLKVSEEITYEISCDDCRPLVRYYLFENSLGGYDTAVITGNLKTGLQTKGIEIELFRSPFATYEQRQYAHRNTSFRKSFVQHVNHLEPDAHRWMLDLVISEDPYRLGFSEDPNDGADVRMWPIIIPRAEIEWKEDEDFLLPISFSYLDAVDQLGQ